MHVLGAVGPFEPADGEMPAGHVLKVVEEHEIDGGTTGGTEDGNGLSGGFFGDLHAEAAGDLSNQADEWWGPVGYDAFLGDEPGGFRNGGGEGDPHGIITMAARVAGFADAAEGQDLEASEFGQWVADFFAFAAGDVGD